MSASRSVFRVITAALFLGGHSPFAVCEVGTVAKERNPVLPGKSK